MLTDDLNRIRRIRIALLIGALALFALLYAPQPVLPQFADAFGLAPGTVALLVSAGTLGLAIAAIPLGTLSEVYGRRRIMVGSLLLAEAIGVLLPFIGNFPLLVALRLVQGAAVAGIAAVAAAYLADETGGRDLGTTMGLYVAGTTVGGMSGRLLGGIAGDYAGWAGGIAAVAVLAGICTVGFVLLLPKERHQRRQELHWKPLLVGVRAAATDPALRPPFLVAALGMGAFVAVYNVLGFRLVEPPLSVPPALAALAFLAYAAGTVTSAVAGGLADRWGRRPVLLTGLGTALLGLLLMLAGNLVVILAGLVVFTGGFFAAHSVASGWVGVLASPSARGQASAMYQLAYYGGSSVGGVVGGIAYAAWGWNGMSIVLGCSMLLAGLAVLRGRRAETARAEPVAAQAQVASES
ncbi:MFS transporter [Saccharopolyspora sp. NPDC047091]|uniref:MFS transporter n=1 Tax=Saccharopolyspora sp. NPDC047091 TaxID=3155924 RepID=UPI0033C88295